MTISDKIRIYELSRDLNLENKDILDAAQKLSISVKSHSSSISAEEAKKIKNLINKKNSDKKILSIKKPSIKKENYKQNKENESSVIASMKGKPLEDNSKKKPLLIKPLNKPDSQKIISNKQVEENPKFDNTKNIYLFDLNKRFSLDGDFSWNTARLINHSCSPNCEVEGTGFKIWVTAIRDIKKNEELTYDYGFSYDSDYKQFPCKCRSKNCCGYIVREESRWRINKKYKKSLRISR